MDLLDQLKARASYLQFHENSEYHFLLWLWIEMYANAQPILVFKGNQVFIGDMACSCFPGGADPQLYI